MPTELAQRILTWYTQNGRSLPWRGLADAYAVWVSEVMLQQTQVDTVIPYFERWMSRFPNIAKLADASEEDVLRVWEGLGYYSRARNLHRAAKMVVSKHDAQLPADMAALRQLPGIGRYTAGAIASIAFGQPEPALDGNIRRVLARLFNLTIPARSTEGEKILWALLSEHLPADQAGDFNQALMDLGASLCTPRAPACERCPVNSLCQSRALGVETERPVVMPKQPIPHYRVTAAILRSDGHVLIARRRSEGLLGGLWEFPGGKQEAGEDLPTCLRREIMEELGVCIEVGTELGVFRHAYTHFRVTLHAFECYLVNGEPAALDASEIRWVKLPDLQDYPMGKIDRQIANTLIKTTENLL